MNHSQRGRRIFVLLTLLAVLASTFMMGATTQAQDEKILVIGHAESTDSLDPAHGYTQTTGIIERATYSTLVTFPAADASAIEPMLATDWSVSDDGLTYTFTLREGVTFSNGDPLTAADVVFSVKRLQNVDGNPSFLADNITDVAATDDLTVVFTLPAPRPSFLSELCNGAFSVTNSKEVMANGGTDADDAATTDAAEAYLNSASAGTGPYILEKWEPQVETVLVRNPNYWGEAPYFDRVIITNIPEAATQKVAMESGEIDMALDLSSDQVLGLQNDPAFTVTSSPSAYTHFLLMNADPEIGGPMSDPKVQQAVRLALDYEGYKALWGGVTPATNLTVGLQYAYGEDKAIKRDVEAAKALLAEAGYPDGFEIDLDYPDFTWQGVNMNTNAQKIQADLAEVGITVNLAPAELQVALEEYRNGQEGFGYWFWGPDVLDPIDVLSFLPGGKVGGDRAHWTDANADPQIIAIRDRAMVATNPAERQGLFAAIQDYLQQNGTFAPFLVPNVQTVYKSDIQGYYFHPQWTLDVAILSLAE